MLYYREMHVLLSGLKNFSVLALVGPRGSGKTTLIKSLFPHHTYVNFNDPEILRTAIHNPTDFLKHYERCPYGLIIDDCHKRPYFVRDVAWYIENTLINKGGFRGSLIIISSYNIFAWKTVKQGEIPLLELIHYYVLMPLSLHEQKNNFLLPADLTAAITPTQRITADLYERIDISQQAAFKSFLRECAEGITKVVDYAQLAVYCNIREKTVHEWLAILEASYLIFLLKPQPLPESSNGRKLYFYDTGLAASLLGIDCSSQIRASTWYPQLFENLIISDICKQFHNRGEKPPLTFWKTPYNHGENYEASCVIHGNIFIYVCSENKVSAYTTLLKKTLNATDDPGNILNKQPRSYLAHIICDADTADYKRLCENYNDDSLCSYPYYYTITSWQSAATIGSSWIKPAYAYDMVFEDDAPFQFRLSQNMRKFKEYYETWYCTCGGTHDGTDCVCAAPEGFPKLHKYVVCDNDKKCHQDIHNFSSYIKGNDSLNRKLDFHKAISNEGGTTLLYAAELGRVDVIRTLINTHAHLNRGDINGVTPLHRAAYCGYNTIVKLLLTSNVLLNARTVQGDTPLFYAVEKGHISIVKLLIAAGADPTVVNYQECTLLHVATYYQHKEIIALLLEQKTIAINARTITGDTALHYAIGLHNPIGKPPQENIVQLLITAGASTDIMNHSGHSVEDALLLLHNFSLTRTQNSCKV